MSELNSKSFIEKVTDGFNDFVEGVQIEIQKMTAFITFYRTGGRKVIRHGINDSLAMLRQVVKQDNMGINLLVDFLKSPELKPLVKDFLDSTLEGARELAPVIKEIGAELTPLFKEFDETELEDHTFKMVFKIDYEKMLSKFGAEETANKIAALDPLQTEYSSLSNEKRKIQRDIDSIKIEGSDPVVIQKQLVDRSALIAKMEIVEKWISNAWKNARELLILVKED